MRIAAFAGLAKAGKTTAAKALAEWAFNEGFHVVMEQFAKPLKDASNTLGFVKGGDYDHLYREFCQYVGTDLVRRKHHLINWWVDRMRERLDVHAMQEQNRLAGATVSAENPFHETLVIIDDVRFENEVALMKEYGARTVFICGARRLTDLDTEWRKHESEALAFAYTRGDLPEDLFDFTLSSNSTIETLQETIVRLGPTLVGLLAEERQHD